ncbi:MAG TPA: SprT family zinc-dependent metalloprotease [Pyrinomonadaceae bacterium]|jgi:predicted metal-dependent hydrolase|nr:SprT family zinc-dependent metalloprotease [Pyrinomonadaceae bacterium]
MAEVALHSVRYGAETIHFGLRHTNRKSLAISVLPDLSVAVTAPHDSPLELIRKKVKKRAPWILKQQDYFKGYLPKQPPRRYVSGETHLYLGKQYRLKVFESDVEAVKLRGGYIHVGVNDRSDTGRISSLLDGWLLSHARAQFERRLKACWERLRKQGIPYPKLRLRQMQKRWGTCTREGVIYLTPNLVKTPGSCIDYVITHELCHLKHSHHGKAFYDMLRRVLPDWEQRKTRLEKVNI